MSIRTDIRKIEAHAKSLTSSKNEQINILSRVQTVVSSNTYFFAVVTIAKSRIIHSLKTG